MPFKNTRQILVIRTGYYFFHNYKG